MIGHNDELYFDLQQYRNGNWTTIHSSYFIGCGNGRYSFFLPPGEMAVTVLTLPNERSAKYRLVAGGSVSNIFY